MQAIPRIFHNVLPRRRGCTYASLALTLLLSPGFSASVSAQVVFEKIIGWSPTSISGISLNDSGQAVWSSGRANSSQVYYWNGTSTQTIGFDNSNNRDAQINNSGMVVFSAYRQNFTPVTTDIYTWNGAASATDISLDGDIGAQPKINNQNQIVWWGQVGNSGINDVIYHDPTTSQNFDLTQNDYVGGSSGPSLNDKGAITWERSTAVNPGGETNLMSSTISKLMGITNPNDFMGSVQQITHRNDLNLINGGLNSLGKMVWVAYNDAAGKYDVWELDPNGSNLKVNLTANLLGDSFDPKVTEDGTVVWYTRAKNGVHSDIYWNYGIGSKQVMLDVSFLKNAPIDINNKGIVLFASGDGTSTGFDLIEAQPIPQGPNVPEPSNIVVLLSAGAAGIAFKFRLRRQLR